MKMSSIFIKGMFKLKERGFVFPRSFKIVSLMLCFLNAELRVRR